MRFATVAALVGVALSGSGMGLVTACGGAEKPPSRGVIENDVADWTFRRYQSVLDVEVWVSDNRAVAHTASYAHKEGVKRGRLLEEDVVSAFVTRYESDAGIDRALVQFARRLAGESGYRVEEREIGDVRVVEIRGAGEVWAIWPARQHVVKIGGPGRQSIPESLIEAYGDRYPSRLAAGALDAPLPAADVDRAVQKGGAGKGTKGAKGAKGGGKDGKSQGKKRAE
jgi:hypothetical protein